MLDSAVNHLKANIKSAADLISLPTTVEELQKVHLNPIFSVQMGFTFTLEAHLCLLTV